MKVGIYSQKKQVAKKLKKQRYTDLLTANKMI